MKTLLILSLSLCLAINSASCDPVDEFLDKYSVACLVSADRSEFIFLRNKHGIDGFNLVGKVVIEKSERYFLRNQRALLIVDPEHPKDRLMFVVKDGIIHATLKGVRHKFTVESLVKAKRVD